MRIYNSSVDLISETTREVFSRGLIAFDQTVQGIEVDSEEYEMKELLAYTFTATPSCHSDKEEMLEWAREHFNKPHLVLEYGKEWVKAMITGDEELEIKANMKYARDYWTKFCKGVFSYTYAERVGNSIKYVIKLLKRNRYRRGAAIPVYYHTDHGLSFQGKRVPCSMFYLPLIRRQGFKDVLHLTYTMRSCDLTNWFPLDIYRAMLLQEYLSKQLDTEVGNLFVFINSLHAYRSEVPSQYQW